MIPDTQGNRREFCRWFHERSAKCINASLGRWENLWASEQTSVVRLVDREAQLAKVAYTVCNPVEAGLVRRGEQWPGVRLGPHDIGADVCVARPAGFFRDTGPLPEVATLRIAKLPALAHLPNDGYVAELDACIEALGRIRSFVRAYRHAWRAYASGLRRGVVFPHGTYWLRAFAGVCCAAPG